MPKSPKTTETFPVITLYGDLEESFYQLGIKDRDRHKLALEHIESILKIGIPKVDLLIQHLLTSLLKKTDPVNLHSFKKEIGAYAEGLNRPVEQIMLAFLTPELFSSLSYWIPGLPANLFGCSSFFARTQSGDLLHGRVLDFPLLGSLDINERGVLFKNQHNPIFSYSSAGLPYACLTVQNSHGVTFAIHQKFSKSLHYQGTPMFQAVHHLMEQVTNADHAIELIKKIPTMTTWCFLLGFPNGERLAIDKNGDEIFIDRKTLEIGEIEYFGNRLLAPKYELSHFMPSSMESYNSMRESNAKEKIDNLIKQNFDEIDLLEMISTPLAEHLKNKKDQRNWRLDTLTPSSLQIVVMNANKGQWYLNPHSAPKIFNGEIIKITNLFDRPSIEKINRKNKKLNSPQYHNFSKGIKALMQSQVAWDLNDMHMAYHHIQMANVYLENTSYRWAAHFYFLLFELITNDHPKTNSLLLVKFKELRKNIPTYHSQLCALFIHRLERILDIEPSISERDIIDEQLKSLFQAQIKLPQITLKQINKHLTKPRIDILDVIHLHVRT